jgi:ribosome recycling factor
MPEGEEISEEEILLESEERMEKSIESFQRDLNNIRSSRAAPGMVDQIQVEYYGAMTPLQQLATISIPEARIIMISPFDKSSMGDIEKALLKSDLGLTPQSDGVVIRLVLPELSGDRRKELVKQVKGRTEDARVAIRNIRRDANDQIKKLKDGGVSEDDIKAAQGEVQKLTDGFIKKAEDLADAKEQDILTI